MGLYITIVKALAATVLHAAANQRYGESTIQSEVTPLPPALPTKPLAPLPSPPLPSSPITRPGCTVADETLTVKGHLEGLAKGWSGFGVLRTSKEKLDKAVRAAQSIKADTIAHELQEISKQLPLIHTQTEAEQILRKIEPLIPQVWQLGMQCKGSSEIIEKAQVLSQEFKKGNLTKKQAVEQLKETIQRKELYA